MTFQSIYFIRFLNNLHEKSVGKQPNAECLWLFHSCTERELCGYSGDPRKVRARESESSLQTETAAAWAGETRRALKSNENLDRNERCLAIELSTLGTYSFSRQSSNSDESSASATLFVTILSALEIRKALNCKDLRSSRPAWSIFSTKRFELWLTQTSTVS